MKRMLLQRVAFALCLTVTLVGIGWTLATFDASTKDLALALAVALMPGSAVWFTLGVPPPASNNMSWDTWRLRESAASKAPY